MEISEEELQKKLDAVAHFEQWRLAFAQASRIALPYLESMTDQYDPQTQAMVKKGVIDPFVYTVFETECDRIMKEYFGKKEEVKKEEVKKDVSTNEE